MIKISKIPLAIALTLLHYLSMAQTTLVDVTKTYPNIKTIEVNGNWLDISYTGGISADVKVEALLQSTDTYQDIVFMTIGEVLKISHKKSSSNASWNKFNKGYIKITGPESIKLNLVSTTGTVNLIQIAADNTLINMTSGEINAQKIKGDLTINSTSGSIRLYDIAGNIKANMTSGQGKIMNVKGSVDYNSTSGTLNAMDITGELNVGLTSGSARVQNIQTLGNIRFTSGSFRAENVGLDPKTTFNGSSGSFRIQTSSNLKSFNYSLKSSSGSLKVGDLTKSKSLEINNGSTKWIRGSISSGSISIEN